MNYVCYKVGLLFPNCTQCESYRECEQETKKSETSQETITVPATA